MKHLSKAEIAIIKARILRGDKYSEIEADYHLNHGELPCGFLLVNCYPSMKAHYFDDALFICGAIVQIWGALQNFVCEFSCLYM